MSFKIECYKALEDIVGQEYVSDAPVVLDGYRFSYGNEVMFGDKFGPGPAAVIMPGSTEEVQAIVKVCNRCKVQFKAIGTGFGPTGLVGRDGFLSLDLRRMNRILEIDEKNMYAVIEPYVLLGALTLEAMKKGLRCYTIGAGPSCSVLASITSVNGMGVSNISAGYGGRVPLGVEWVLPTGEILKLGSLGAGAGWFTGDGPGPSLRGIMRGFVGAMGGIGVFTKAAVKLAPWYGPPRLETTGNPPSYEIELPECFAAYTILFPSRQKLLDAMHAICEEGIAYSLYRRGPYAVTAGMTGSNEELWELWQTGYWQEKCQDSLNIAMDSSSPRELDYKEKIFRAIVKKYEGEMPPELNDDPHGKKARFAHSLLSIGAVKGAFRGGGTFHEGVTGDESLTACQNMIQLGMPFKEKYAKKGMILDDGDCCPIHPYEDGYDFHMETPVRLDPYDLNAAKEARDFGEETVKAGLKANLTIGLFDSALGYQDEVHDMAGPECLNYHLWIRKIKKAFDPNQVSESSFFTTPNE